MTPATFITLILLAGSIGWTLGVALPAPTAYLAVAMAAAVVVVEAFRRLDRPRGKLMAAGEATAVALTPVAAVALIPDAEAATLFVGVVATLTSWLLTQITVSDLDAVVDPADSIESATSAPERLRARFLWVGLAQSVAVVAGHGGLVPPVQSRTIAGGFVLSFLAYWLIGLAALSTVERQHRIARWKRDHAVVDADIGNRWVLARTTLLTIAAVGAVVVLVLGRPALSALHAATSWISAGLTSLVARLTGNPPRQSPPNPVPPTGAVPDQFVPDPGNTAGAPGEWLDFVLLVAFALVFLGVYTVFTRRRAQAATPGTSSVWRQVGRLLLDLVRAITQIPAAIVEWWRRRRHREDASPGAFFRRPRIEPWQPADPFRRRIASEFRSYLRTAESRQIALGPQETPLEFGARLEEAGSPAVGRLTDLYSLARYSNHLLGDTEAREATAARRQAVTDLDQDPP
jgi:Domain of unknown function (DUF4129)